MYIHNLYVPRYVQVFHIQFLPQLFSERFRVAIMLNQADMTLLKKGSDLHVKSK